MASRFLIQVKLGANEPREIRVLDESQYEATDWVPVPSQWTDHPLEVQLAAVCRASEEVLDMLKMAAQVAYSVLLNDEEFDVHGFLERQPVLLAEAKANRLGETLSATPSSKPPRL
jgi:hypothetical protein